MSLRRVASLFRKLRSARRRPRAARGRRPLLEQLEDRLTPSTLIPVTNHRDLVYDASRNQLDITTSAGQVQRWDVGTQTLLSAYAVGSSLYGADVTPDGAYLYATEGQVNNGQATVHKVNLSTGAVTNLTYAVNSGETGSYSIALGGNGKALFDGMLSGSGWVPLRQIDLTTDTLSTRSDDPSSGFGGEVRQNTVIRRGPDRSLFLLTESNISNGPAFTYNAPSDTFSKAASYTSMFLDNRLTAVNRNGTLIAVEMFANGTNPGSVSVLDANLHVVKNLPAIDGGVAFDPTQDVLYGVSTPGGVLVAFDTNTWAVKYTAPIGEAVSPATQYGNGVMAVTPFSPNGQFAFVSTAQGVREILLPPPTGIGTVLVPGPGFPTYIEPGVPGTITITAKDPAGNVVPGFRDTVHFTSSDGAANLPPDYTFQASDNGVHTFTVTLNTAGTQSINVTDVNHGFGVGQGGITVHPALATRVVPVTDHKDLVYDPTRNYLYVTTAHGTVERYDVAHQTLLAPFQVGVSLLGADITPDGKALYVADGQRGATQGSFHAVDLTTGAVTDLNYTLTSPSWTVRLDAHGTGVADEQFEGSGWVPLYEVDTAQNTLTQITTDPGSDSRGDVRQNTGIYRSADRSYFFFTESNISSGPIFSFDFNAGGTWSKAVNTNAFLDNAPAAVNRNGTLIALQISGNTLILDKTLNLSSPVKKLTGVTGALGFDPVRDLLYVASGSTVTAYNTGTWAVQFTLPIGESVGSPSAFGNGAMTVSGDDRYLFVAGPSGVHVLGLPVTNQVVVSGFPTSTTAGVAGSVTVTVEDGNGQPLTNYTGTVHFTSTDPQAMLPADYTFVSGDGGTHTFTNGVTLKTAGTQSVTVTDNGTPPLSGSETNISVSAAAASSLTLSGLPATVGVGSPVSVTVTAKDPYGNKAAGYRGTVTFTSSDGQATLPAPYGFTAGDGGAHNFTNGVTLKTLGTQSVTVSDGTLQNSASTNVVAGQATQLVVTAQPPGMVAPGEPFGLTVTAEDANGDVDASFSGNVALALSSNPGGATLGGTTTVKASNGVAAFTGLTLDKTGIGYKVQASSAGLSSGATNPFDVDALALSGSSVLEFRPVGTQVGTLSTTPGTGHTFTYSLVSGAGSTDNASFTISGGQLVTADAFDAGAKSSYSVRVRTTDERGLSLEQPFTVTITDDPALTLSSGTLVVSGTTANDAFSFTPGAPQDAMKLNGTALAVDAASVPGGVAFSGNGGSDSATLTTGGSGPSGLSLSPGGGTLSGAGYRVALSGVGQVIALGRPGDRATLTGSAGPDAFLGTPGYAYLNGSGFFNQANGFGVVVAVGNGGGDTAYLYGDPAGGNVFAATPGYAYLRGGTSAFFNQANGFQTIIGTAAAGTDQAYLYGGGGNVFVGTPTNSYLYGGGGPWEQAIGFKYLIAVAPGPGNSAYFYGGAGGGNVLVAAPSYAYLNGGGALAYAAGFQTVVGAAGSATDSAYLYGAPGATFVATSSSASMTGGGATAQASGFGSVYAYSGGGGQAYLYGTMTSADTFVDGGGYAVLFGAGFFDYAGGFASVWANPYAHR